MLLLYPGFEFHSRLFFFSKKVLFPLVLSSVLPVLALAPVCPDSFCFAFPVFSTSLRLHACPSSPCIISLSSDCSPNFASETISEILRFMITSSSSVFFFKEDSINSIRTDISYPKRSVIIFSRIRTSSSALPCANRLSSIFRHNTFPSNITFAFRKR